MSLYTGADAERNGTEQGRGRHAEEPSEIPAAGWKDIAVRVKNELADDHTSLMAAGVAFFSFVAIIPGFAAALSIYGILANPSDVVEQLRSLLGGLPDDAQQLVADQLQRLAGESSGALGWGAALGIVLALWTASSGMGNLIEALNVAYDEKDERGFLVKRGLALAFTLGAIVMLGVAIIGIGVLLPFVRGLGLPSLAEFALIGAFWLAVALVLSIGLGILYRWAPDRDEPEWRWITWGSALAVVLWIVGSIVFQIYVSNFGSYDATYGSLAAIVVLLFWFYLTSFIVMLGAQINSEIEHQTMADTTVGRDRPMGQRDAKVADTLGQSVETAG